MRVTGTPFWATDRKFITRRQFEYMAGLKDGDIPGVVIGAKMGGFVLAPSEP